MLNMSKNKFAGNRKLGGDTKDSRLKKKNKRKRSVTGSGLNKKTLPGIGKVTKSNVRKRRVKSKTGGNRPLKPATNGEMENRKRIGHPKGRLLSKVGKLADEFESRERGPAAKLFRVLAPLAVLCLLSVGGYYSYRFVTTSPHFEVTKVNFSPTERVSEEDLLKLSGLEDRPNIFNLDLNDVANKLEKHPWIAKAKAMRRLPSTVEIEVEEELVAGVVSLEALYLVNKNGKVFKRARQEEALDYTLITGIDRSEYQASPTMARKRFTEALKVLDKYRRKRRPVIGEVHLSDEGVVLYTREKGVEIRLGKGSIDTKLLRLDRVLTALGSRSGRVRVIYLDNLARPERVTIRLAQADADIGSHEDTNSDG